MIKLKLVPGEPITCFIQVKGKNGIREFKAVLDTGAKYCVIPISDARQLGYDAYWDYLTRSGKAGRPVLLGGILEADEIILEEVIIGDLVAKNLEAFAYDIPRLAGIEAILGVNFLSNFKTTLDYQKGYLTMEPT
jgi:predicted aspartyl protease